VRACCASGTHSVRFAQPGDPVPFLFLARAFEACGETTGRLEISATVANALRTILVTTPADLLPAVYLCSCSVAPQYEGVDLGVGEATLLKALAESTGRAEEFIKTAMATDGDLGIVAMKCRATQRTMFPMPILTVRGVFATLREIAKTQGAKASERKRGLIKKLLVSARDIEAGYVMRMLQGKLGVGIAQQTVITALSHAALLQEHAAKDATKDATALSVLSGTPLADQLSEADAVLRQVYSECPTWDLIVPALLSNGVMALPTTCHFVPGIPIKPMLAKATRGACACAAAHSMAALSRYAPASPSRCG
jgi:DNA ligase-1